MHFLVDTSVLHYLQQRDHRIKPGNLKKKIIEGKRNVENSSVAWIKNSGLKGPTEIPFQGEYFKYFINYKVLMMVRYLTPFGTQDRLLLHQIFAHNQLIRAEQEEVGTDVSYMIQNSIPGQF